MPGAEKRKTHSLGLDKAIADLNSVTEPAYIILDALAGMQATWEYPEDRFEMGLILAGSDPIAVDTVGTCLMGFDPSQVMHLQYFARRRRTVADFSRVEVVGEPVEKYRRNLKSGFEVFKSRYPGVTIIEGRSSCSGCIGELIGALSAIRDSAGEQALQDISVILGNPIKAATTDKTVVLGKCARRLARLGWYVRGCPPHDDDMIKALCEVCNLDAEFVIASRNSGRTKRWEETKTALAQ